MVNDTGSNGVEEPTTLASIINRSVAYWKSTGFPEDRIKEIYGDYYSELENPHSRIPVSLTKQMLNEIAQHTQDGSIAFKTGLEISIPTLNAFGYLMLTCPTVEKMISYGVQFQGFITSSYQALFLKGNPRSAYDLIIPSYSNITPFQIEISLGVLFGLIREVVDISKYDLKLYLKHNNDDLCQNSLERFGLEIIPNSKHYSIQFESTMLELPVSFSEPAVNEQSRALLKRLMKPLNYDQFYAELCLSIIEEYLDEGATKIEFLANAMQVSERTIQLRLAAQNLTFRQLIKQVKDKKAH